MSDPHTAIAKVHIGPLGSPWGTHSGTAWLFSECHALTAAHCVGDRTTRVLHPGPFRLLFPSGIEVACEIARHDFDLDVALLELASPQHIDPLPLGTIARQSLSPGKFPWRSYGFARAQPTGINLSGSITSLHGNVEGKSAIQLLCDQGGSGALEGTSGAPVFHGEVVIGVIRHGPPALQQRVVYATAIDQIVDIFPAVAARPRKSAILEDLEPGALPEPADFGDVPSYPPNLRLSLGESFVGRAEEAWQIHKALQGTRGARAPVLLHAAGGFGKTRLALEYMHRFGPRRYPGGLFWVDAAVGPELLEEQFHEILRRLDKNVPDLLECRRLGVNIRGRLSEALEKAASQAPVLYIVDNVPEATERAGARLPLETWCPAISKVSLIATSRDLWVTDVHPVAVSALSPEAAEALLAAGLSPATREHLEKGAARELTQWVGCHPLALEILNVVLRHRYVFPEDVLALARRQRPTQGVEQYFRQIQGREPTLKRGVIETFELSYAQISKFQQRLARLLAQLAAEPVPRLLARKLAPTPLTDDALSVLLDRHFVTPVEAVGGVELYGEMHRLLADYLRYRGDKPRQELRQACGAVDSAISELSNGGPEVWPLLNACLPHAENLLERLMTKGADTWAERLRGEGLWDMVVKPRGGEEILLGLELGRLLLKSGRADQAERIVARVWRSPTSQSKVEDVNTLSLRLVLAEALQARGAYAEAEKHYEAVLEAARRTREDHWLTLRVRNCLASLWLAQGRLRKAREQAEEVLAACRRVLPADDEETLLAMAHMAASWRALGRADKAEKLQEQVLETRRRTSEKLGAESLAVLEAMSDLALSQYVLRDLHKAEKLQEQVLEARRQLLGEQHPATLVAMDQLGETRRELWKLPEARKLQVLAVKAMRKSLGKDHLLTLEAKGHLAATHRERGRAAKARKCQERVLGQLENRLVENHPTILKARSGLALTLHQEQERWAEARRLQASVVEGRTQVLGKDHPETLEAIVTLARILREQGDWEEAFQRGERALKVARGALGEDHPETLRSMSYLALSLAARRQWEGARHLQEWVLKERLRKWGEKHPDTLLARDDLASTLYEQGYYADAGEHYRAVVEARLRVHGPEHPSTLTAMGNLASTLRNLGEWAKARKLAEAVVKGRRRVLGPEHPSTLMAMGNLAAMLRDQGEWAKARKLSETVVEGSRRVLGPEHPSTLIAMGNLADTLSNLGEWAEARKLAEEVVKGMHRALGPEHPYTLTAMDTLARAQSKLGEWAEARKLAEEVVKGRRRVLGPEHPFTITAMCNLALTLSKLGEWAEARKLEEVVVEVSRRVLGPEHPDTLSAMANLAATLGRHFEWAEARKLAEVVVEGKRRVLGPEHPNTLTAMDTLAGTLSKLGEWAEARKLEEAVVEVKRRVLGSEHPDTLTAMGNLSTLLSKQGEWAEARKLAEAVVEVRRRVLGPEHLDTLKGMAFLAELETPG